MGRWNYSNRYTVEESKRLSTIDLKDWGYFKPISCSGNIHWSRANTSTGSISIAINEKNTLLYLSYTITSRENKDKQSFNYNVKIVTSKCNYGGVRYWFICPLNVNGKTCDRRISTLYLPPDGNYFGCRHCHDLTYEAQKEHNKSLDIFKSFEYNCKIERLFNTGRVKDRNKALKLMIKRDNHIEKHLDKITAFNAKNKLPVEL